MANFKAIRIDTAEKGTTAALTQLNEAQLKAGHGPVRAGWPARMAVCAGGAGIRVGPVFQGPALSLRAGEVAALLLSRTTVPITYDLTHRGMPGRAVDPAVPAA